MFLTGVICAAIATQVPLFATIIPTETLKLLSPIAKSSIANQEKLKASQLAPLAKTNYRFISTQSVKAEVDLKRMAELDALFNKKVGQYESPMMGNQDLAQADERQARRFVTQQMESWVQNSQLKNSGLVRAIDSVENGLSDDLYSQASKEENATSLKIKVRPLSAIAEVRYHGDIDAVIQYRANSDELNLKLFKVIEHTEYSVNSISNEQETRSTVNMAWAF
jgi:hypothetical protein